MPNSKSQRAEKISTDQLTDETLDVVNEMLNIIVSRTQVGELDKDFKYARGDLKYFGVGNQLKVSKLADTLYATLKDVVVFVISEMARDSTVDIKFQMPKYTSFVGSIVKSVAIDVIAHSDAYRNYLDTLANSQGKYLFDSDDSTFLNIYRDTVIALNDRGFLFEDNPELQSVQHEFKEIIELDTSMNKINGLTTLACNSEDIVPDLPPSDFSAVPPKGEELSEDGADTLNSLDTVHGNSRNRVIFPYLRRLFETKKSIMVTRRRVAQVAGVVEPSEAVKQAYEEKYNEVWASCQQMRMPNDTIRAHCMVEAIQYLREHFSKEEVDLMEQYLQSMKASMPKFRRRYVKVPSGKRLHFPDGVNGEYMMPLPPESL